MYKVLNKKTVCVALFLFATLIESPILGQNAWQITASTGGERTTIDFCLGDLIIGTSSIRKNTFLTYGFNQNNSLSKITAVSKSINNKPNIYPNPVTDRLYLKANDKLNKIVVTNIKGEIVINKTYSIGDYIDVSNIARGIYFISLKSTNEIWTTKFIKL